MAATSGRTRRYTNVCTTKAYYTAVHYLLETHRILAVVLRNKDNSKAAASTMNLISSASRGFGTQTLQQIYENDLNYENVFVKGTRFDHLMFLLFYSGPLEIANFSSEPVLLKLLQTKKNSLLDSIYSILLNFVMMIIYSKTSRSYLVFCLQTMQYVGLHSM